MRLHRYELYLDGEEQKVGFMVGLNYLYDVEGCSIGFVDEYIDGLLEQFNDELPFPPAELSSKTVCAFTDFGNTVFGDSIQRIIKAYQESMFEVKELIVEIEDDELDKLEYQDKYQAAISIDLFNRIKHEAIHQKAGAIYA